MYRVLQPVRAKILLAPLVKYKINSNYDYFNQTFPALFTCDLLLILIGYLSPGRRGGLVISMLDSGSRGPGSSPGRVIVLCFWAKHFTLTVPLSTQEYKWVPANCQGNLMKCWEVTCDRLASHPGGVAIFLVASCYGNWDKLRQ